MHLKGKGRKDKAKSKEDLNRTQMFQSPASNDALNFSTWFRTLLSPDFVERLSQGARGLHFPSADFGTRWPTSGRYTWRSEGNFSPGFCFFLEANLFCRSTYWHCGRNFCRQLTFDLANLLFNQPMDLLPFTRWIAFPATTWVTLCRRFTTSGTLSITSADVPCTSAAAGNPLLSFFIFAEKCDTFLTSELVLPQSQEQDFC